MQNRERDAWSQIIAQNDIGYTTRGEKRMLGASQEVVDILKKYHTT